MVCCWDDAIAVDFKELLCSSDVSLAVNSAAVWPRGMLHQLLIYKAVVLVGCCNYC